MSLLRVVRTEEAGFAGFWVGLRARLSLESAFLDRERLAGVRGIVEAVRERGDAAVAEYTTRFDKVDLRPEEFRAPAERLTAAHARLDGELLATLRRAIGNVRDYQERIKAVGPGDWAAGEGVRLGLRYRALRRVGVCVPGASAPLPSTVIMTVVPALVAGVREVAVVTSPKREFADLVHPAILGLCEELRRQWGARIEVYRVSGAQAVAALAMGTGAIGRVDKIVGPGNWWGQLAKKEVFGLVDIDSFAGPSEVLVLADETAEAQFVAADLLSQAEHAPGSAVLMTESAGLAQRVAAAVEEQLGQLERGEQTRACVREFAAAVVVRDRAEMVRLANEFAAEHLQVQTADAQELAQEIVNAGAIFVGPFTPVAVGDYYAGPSHTLPTGASARFFSALNVNDFLKQSSVISYSREGLAAAAGDIVRLAEVEGLTAHARSVSRRVQGGSR